MSKTIIEIRKNSYSDSVTLMSVSAEIKKTEGIFDAVISMATAMNKELLERVGMMTDDVRECTENDLVIALRCEDAVEKDDIIALIDEKLKGNASEQTVQEEIYRTIKSAKENQPDANMAVISVPGEHAAREAMLALKQGMNVMLFSDNVTIEEEKQLKEYAHAEGLLVMGPDCGTAYINHTALCFANKVREGSIGIVGASGTGMQEIMVLIDRYGGGISNAIGVGGRDLTAEIGGIMLIDGLRMLQQDMKTKTIVIVSKVPAPEVKEKILEVIQEEITKPVLVYFATDMRFEDTKQVHFGTSLAETARAAVETNSGISGKAAKETAEVKKQSTIKKIRGLYCGGTLCSEAYYYLRNRLEHVHSNVAKKEEEQLRDVFVNEGHTLLDLGDDVFTNGRPHPMIDPTIRLDRILESCEESDTGVILLDFELGYGSHEDPVGATIAVIKDGMEIAKKKGNDLKFVTYVLGTDGDTQDKRKQEQLLSEAGCIVAESNIDAVRQAYKLVVQ
ncbi:MAG: acyl-CoA synthetase FdrA [Lachnospiraceae bacterium]